MGAENVSVHSSDWDPVTVPVGQKWGWKCLCGEKSRRTWVLEMDAHQDWSQHKEGFPTAEPERSAAPKPNTRRSRLIKDTDDFIGVVLMGAFVLVVLALILGAFLFEIRR